jgi:hypothetical protein
MKHSSHASRAPLLVLCAAMAAALIAFWLVPGSVIDRTLFTWVARGSYNPPIVANPSPDRGWRLVVHGAADPHRMPLCMVSLGDDPQGVFQQFPQSPIDLAVVFSNMRRLGVRHAGSSSVLAWDQAQAIDIAALEQSIDAFDAFAVTAPVTRGALPQAMPTAFRRASLPVSGVDGGAQSLPVVNCLALPDVFLGTDRSVAGFQHIESEPEGKVHLMARWGDRIILAFELVVAMQQAGVDSSDVSIKLGHSIRLGLNGPLIPIDAAGCLKIPAMQSPRMISVAAEELIDRQVSLVDPSHPLPVVLRDERSLAEPATRRFSERLPTVLTILLGSNRSAVMKPYPRPGIAIELMLLGAICLGLAATSTRPNPFVQTVCILIAAAGWIVLVVCAFAWLQCWLPAAEGGAALIASMLTLALLNRRSAGRVVSDIRA